MDFKNWTEQAAEMQIPVCKKQCDQCLFSKNKIVSDERKAEILAELKKKRDYFVCHKGTLKGKKVICGGYYHTIQNTLLKKANHFGMLKFIDPKTI